MWEADVEPRCVLRLLIPFGCFAQLLHEFKVLEGLAAAVVERIDLFLEAFPVGWSRRGVVVPGILVGTLELPLDFVVAYKSDACFSFNAVVDSVCPFEVGFHGDLYFG